MTKQKLTSCFRASGIVAGVVLSIVSRPVAAVENGLGDKPYLGWSSWSLETTKYPGYGGMNWLSAAHVKEQSDAIQARLQKHGYRYINIDSGWRGGWDNFGRPMPDMQKFPQGIAEVAQYVHAKGQKLGIYYVPGIDDDLLKQNPLIEGTTHRVADIVFVPQRIANAWGGGHAIDFSKPGAPEYIDSIARLFASWGVDFLKFDGVTPGSGTDDGHIDARDNVAAWSRALGKVGRPIWLTISWKISGDMTFWRQYANAWRVNNDVETYGNKLTAWPQVGWRFDEVRGRVADAGRGKGWNDLDALLVGSGEMDGLNRDERQSMMTLWAVCCSPLYAGDDLTKLDDYGVQLLTNDEVIAVQQAGHPASLLRWGDAQVWSARQDDGSVTVALFNLSDRETREVEAKWADLGIVGAAKVRDLWAHADLGEQKGRFVATLAPHASRLLRITPRVTQKVE
jgi:hypothetical protein